MSVILRLLVATAAAAAVAGVAVYSPDDPTALAYREGGRWVTWWRSDTMPARWDGGGPLAARVAWRAGVPGVEWGELQLRGAGEAWRTRVVLARLDPGQVGLALAPAFTEDRRWTVADAHDDAAVAFAGGQFRGSLPWGWVVSGGREVLSPQYAPLAGAVVVDSTGGVRIVAPDSVAAARRRGGVREAFQSYPVLLQDGAVPAALTKPGSGVNVAHRDARLALCTMPDDRVVVALTRFDALGATLGRVPFGLTSAEMAAVMGGLGCRQALLLDGGISGQLRIREANGSARTWAGTRSVPLGLIGRPRIR
jgi:hypothetical protein